MKRAAIGLWGLLVSVAATGCSSGVSGRVMAALERSEAPEQTVIVERVEPRALVRAARTPEGVYHVETRFDDGRVRHHSFDPATHEAAAWASAADAALSTRLVSLEAESAESFPARAVPIAVTAAGEGPALDLRNGALFLREGADFQPVALYPLNERRPPRRQGAWGGRLRQAGLAAILPFAVAVDVALLSTVVLAPFVLLL